MNKTKQGLIAFVGTNAYSVRARQLTEEMGGIVEGLERERNELSAKLHKIRAACQEAAEEDRELAAQLLHILESSD